MRSRDVGNYAVRGFGERRGHSYRKAQNELRRGGGGLGLAAICSGGGQGDALLLEV